MKGVQDLTLDERIIEYIQQANAKTPPYMPTIADVARYLSKSPYTIRDRLFALEKEGKLIKNETSQPGRTTKRTGYMVSKRDRDFNSARFYNEGPCECNACGKRIATGVRININKPKDYFKSTLVFCNDCWIPPEIETMLNNLELKEQLLCN